MKTVIKMKETRKGASVTRSEVVRYAALAAMWTAATLLVFAGPDLDMEHWFAVFFAMKAAGFGIAIAAFFLMVKWMKDGKADTLLRYLENED